MTPVGIDSFYCSIPGHDRDHEQIVFREFPFSGAAIGIVRSFSEAGYWNSAVPSVSSKIRCGICFSIARGISAYLYQDSAFANSLFITVSILPAQRPLYPDASVRFHRHESPRVRRVSCGHISTKCTAFRL